MKTTLLLSSFLGIALASSAADSPKDAVKAAAKKLTDKGNYSYVSTAKFAGGGGGGGSRFTPGPTEGKVEGDVAVLKSTTGENTTEAVVKGAKGVAKTQEGWRTAEEIRQSAQGGGGGKGGFVRGFAATRLISNYKTPAAQAAELADKATALKEADGAISGALPEATARELMSFGGRGGGGGGQARQISGAKASVKFWLKDGMLSKYEITTEGSMSFNNNDINLGRTTTVEIKDVGTTKATIPEDAKARLQ